MRYVAKRITPQAFRPFGWLIHYPGKKSKSRKVNLWKIVLRETRAKGWRIAYLVLRDKSLKRLEQHPSSFESFEPLKGKSLLFVAKNKTPRAIQCFCLDRPVILKKGIWHGLITLTPETEIKVTENARVRCVYRALKNPIQMGHTYGMCK